MQVRVHTDNHIDGSQRLAEHVESVLEDSLSRFGERVISVEVHLTDENSSAKSGDADKRCAIEARLAGLQPIAVSHQAGLIDQAINGAAEKLERALDHKLDRLSDHKGRTSYSGDQTLE
ncbi:MAG: HPF/RaiA family ribosome-associated protein [Aureliella sp.]